MHQGFQQCSDSNPSQDQARWCVMMAPPKQQQRHQYRSAAKQCCHPVGALQTLP
ncbi:Uncharacterised protein [Vibrio cholerae]|nr:Uncharacterised protein [Vibrio cholerae]